MPNKLRGSYTFLGLYTCFFKKKKKCDSRNFMQSKLLRNKKKNKFYWVVIKFTKQVLVCRYKKMLNTFYVYPCLHH